MHSSVIKRLARVRRLLAPLPSLPPHRALLVSFGVGLAFVVGVVAGVSHGDAFLRVLPFVAG